MDSVTFSDDLSAGQREEVARHYAQTRHLNYGTGERIKALYFRLAYDDPAVADRSVPAAFLAALAEGAKSGSPVKVPPMSKPDRVRVSELLLQSASRASSEARDDAVTKELRQIWAAWDTRFKVPSDAADRSEYVTFQPGRPAGRPATPTRGSIETVV